MKSRNNIANFPCVCDSDFSSDYVLKANHVPVIHPDKCPHERAPEAFDTLKKAESELLDEKRREELDAMIKQARTMLLKEHSLPLNTTDDDPKLQSLIPPFKQQLRAKSKEVLIDEEVRRRK